MILQPPSIAVFDWSTAHAGDTVYICGSQILSAPVIETANGITIDGNCPGNPGSLIVSSNPGISIQGSSVTVQNVRFTGHQTETCYLDATWGDGYGKNVVRASVFIDCGGAIENQKPYFTAEKNVIFGCGGDCIGSGTKAIAPTITNNIIRSPSVVTTTGDCVELNSPQGPLELSGNTCELTSALSAKQGFMVSLSNGIANINGNTLISRTKAQNHGISVTAADAVNISGNHIFGFTKGCVALWSGVTNPKAVSITDNDLACQTGVIATYNGGAPRVSIERNRFASASGFESYGTGEFVATGNMFAPMSPAKTTWSAVTMNSAGTYYGNFNTFSAGAQLGILSAPGPASGSLSVFQAATGLESNSITK